MSGLSSKVVIDPVIKVSILKKQQVPKVKPTAQELKVSTKK